MMCFFKVLNLLLILVTSQAAAASLDPFASLKCSIWDSGCLINAAQLGLSMLADGVPNLNTQSLDPLKIPLLVINQGGLKAEVSDIVYEGVSTAIVKKFSVDKFSKQAKIRAIVPSLSLNGTYKAAGFLHTLPFNGKGEVYVRATDVEIDAIIDYDIREDEKGNKYAELNKYYYSFEVLGDLITVFGNLYFGDHVQSAATHTYLHKHWKLLTAEFGRAVLNPIADNTYYSIKYLLHILPLNKIITDY